MEKKLKIGILTIYNVLNYGAVLQAYALQKVLEGYGHEVYIVNYQPQELIKPYKTIIFKKLRSLSYILRLFRRVFLFSTFKTFIKNHIKEGMPYYSLEILKKKPPEADVFIVGSDQVWNEKLTGPGDFYFLSFTRKSKRVAYAASCGGNYTFLKDSLKTNYLKQFDLISVREKSFQKELEKEKIYSDLVLDPTLLLDDYSALIGKNLYGKYIAVYNVVSDKNFNGKLAYLKKKTNFTIINIGPHFLNSADRNLLGTSPSNWLTLLFHSKFVFTNSFHGVAFSLIFKKRFFYIPHGTSSDFRVLDLLKECKLSHFVINESQNIDFIIELEETQDNLEKLSALRQHSFSFLNRVINKKDD